MIFLRSRSILQNTVLLTLADLSLRSVSLLYQIYLSRTIGAAGMGKMQLVLTVGGFAMTLGTSGVRVAAMNLTARQRGLGCPAGVKKSVFACLLYGLAMSLFAGFLLYCAAPVLARTFVKDPQVLPAICLLAIGLPVNCLVAVLSGCYTALGKIRILVCTEVLERLLSIGATVLLLQFWAKGDLGRVCSSVIGGSILSTAVSLVLLGLFLYRELKHISGARNFPIRRKLLGLCIPLALSDYLRSGLSTLEQFLIPRGLSRQNQAVDTSMADYGTISGMVFPVLMFPAALFYSLSDLLVPELSRCQAQNRNIRIRTVCARCLKTGIVFSAMVAGLLFLLAPELGQLLYHSQAAGSYLRLFSPMILMLYSDAMTDGMLKGLGEQVASVRYNTITAACDVVLLYFLLPRWGIVGFIFTFALTHGINFYLSLRRLVRVTGFSPDLVHALKTIAVAFCATAFTLRLAPPIAKALSLILSGSVFCLSFFLLCRIFRVFHPRELLQYLPKRKKKHPAQKSEVCA